MRPDQQDPSYSIVWLVLALVNLAMLFALI